MRAALLTVALASTSALHVAPATTRRSTPPRLLLGIGELNPPKTIGDAKYAFNAAYGRPVNGMQQGFVNELLSSSTIAIASSSYKYSRIFAVGFESLCTAFLEGVSNDDERERLRSSMCIGLGIDPKKMQKDAAALEELAKASSEEALLASDDFRLVASTPNWKYSYAFGAGLLALMPLVGSEASDEVIDRWCESLNLNSKRLKTDWAFYVDASQKMVEGRQMLLEMAAATKRKEAQKLKDEAEKAAKEAKEAEEAAAATGGEDGSGGAEDAS